MISMYDIVLPILDNPVIHSISPIPNSQYPMIQLICIAVLVIIDATGVELELVARCIYGNAAR